MLEPAARADGEVLRLTHRIGAARPRVFRAFTEAETFARWWGPPGCAVRVLELDARPEGAYRVEIDATAGTQLLFGRYVEVAPPERLAFTWQWQQGEQTGPESLVTIDFRNVGAAATDVDITHAAFPTAADRDQHEGGWRHVLARLDDVLNGGDQT